MEKTKILLIAVLITLGVIVVVLSTQLSGLSLTSLSISMQEANIQTPNSHAWTKAICNKDNFCQDYIIECDKETPTKLSPITGASVQFDNDWQDPRSLEQRERLCE